MIHRQRDTRLWSMDCRMTYESDSGGALPPDEFGAVPDNERRETLREIEEIVLARRRSITADHGEGRRGASGALLPAVVNSTALFFVAAALVFLPRLYDVGERRILGPESAQDSGGSELFRAFREEAEGQIQEREETIEILRGEYDKARGERESLRRNFDDLLQTRARELAARSQAQLEAERARLAEEGLSTTQTVARLTELKEKLERERSAEMEAYAARLRAEAEERERQLAAAAARYNEKLTEQTDPLKAEIQRLAAQSRTGEAERRDLERRYMEAKAQGETIREAYEGRLSSLDEELRRSRETLVGLEASESARAAVRKRLDALIVADAEAQSDVPAESPQLLELLKAKVEVRALLAEEPAKSTHPGLADRLDHFFREYEDVYRAEGRRRGLTEATEILEGLRAWGAAPALPPSDPELTRFLERLSELLRQGAATASP